jgi:hypothetical protein
MAKRLESHGDGVPAINIANTPMGAASPERVVMLAEEVGAAVRHRTDAIRAITARTKMLALNALIEAKRAGTAGTGFAVVANEVKDISSQVEQVAVALESELAAKARELEHVGARMLTEVRGQRLADLAMNAIEIIDRNLYERTCDVRWWATDAAVVQAVSSTDKGHRAHASDRLSVILDAYTVYLDIWLIDANGQVVATGRPNRFPVGAISVAEERWFRDAMASASGDDYTVADIAANPALGGALTATYAAAIREDGEKRGKPLGVIAVHFDWESQAQTVVRGVRLTPEESRNTRVFLLDSNHRIIAASDGRELLTGQISLKCNGQKMGYYRTPNATTVGFAATPGYETYKGLGWYGCLVQTH